VKMPGKHSFSSINNFTEICQRRHYHDKISPSPFSGEAAERGTHVHAALEAVAKAMALGKTAEEATEFITIPTGILSPEVIKDYLVRAIPAMDCVQPLRGTVERWFRKARSLPVVGKTDLVSRCKPLFQFGEPCGFEENTPCVIDHKTTARPEKVLVEEEAREALQLRLYCLANGTRSAGYIWHLPEGPAMGVSVTFSDEELAETEAELTETLADIDSKWAMDKEEAFLLHPRPNTGLCRHHSDVKWGGCPHFEKCFGAR